MLCKKIAIKKSKYCYTDSKNIIFTFNFINLHGKTELQQQRMI